MTSLLSDFMVVNWPHFDCKVLSILYLALVVGLFLMLCSNTSYSILDFPYLMWMFPLLDNSKTTINKYNITITNIKACIQHKLKLVATERINLAIYAYCKGHIQIRFHEWWLGWLNHWHQEYLFLRQASKICHRHIIPWEQVFLSTKRLLDQVW